MSFKLLSVAVLSLGLATSAMAQSAGSAGGASGNSGNTNEGGGSGAATAMQPVPTDNTITNSTMIAPGSGTAADMQTCSSSTQGAGAPGSSKTDTAATDPACKDK